MSFNENEYFKRNTSSMKKRLKIKKVYSKAQIVNKIEYPGSEIIFKKALSVTNYKYNNKVYLKKTNDEDNENDFLLSNPLKRINQDIIKDQREINKEISYLKQSLHKENQVKYKNAILDKAKIIKEISDVFNLIKLNNEKNLKITKNIQNLHEDDSHLINSLNNLQSKAEEIKYNLETKNKEIVEKIENVIKINQQQQLDMIKSLKSESDYNENKTRSIKKEINLLDEIINDQNNKIEELLSVNQTLEERKEKNYNIKMEYILNTLLLKPYYRKFLILRSSENFPKNSFKICKKTRKTFTIIKPNNIEVKIGFDYIFSQFDSLYNYFDPNNEEISNSELIKIFSNYIGEGTQHGIMFLYITQLKSKYVFDHPISTIFSQLLMSYGLKYQYTIKMIMKEEVKEIVKNVNNEIENNFFTLNKTKCFKDDLALGFIFTMSSVANNSKITFIVTDLQNYSMINLILSKFNEENNIAIKKKTKSFTKRKLKKDYQFFFEEIKQFNTLYYASFMDIKGQGINLEDDNLNEILLNL